ncbi:hypothetical protein HNY73_008058 [Argiope bruennichi]|uniref:Uncharacterized protein n=1 Tax=Argiope bruennichi TaxID=94029 RepID=A0A8T0FA53_ARGBR|nr:hypothetical protein HNY73_008058 [Argiope bruennichi]
MPGLINVNRNTENIEEEVTSHGHQFRFAFSVLNLVNVQPYTFKQNIWTNCGTLPTSWSLEMIFTQDLDTKTASCTLTARRTDSIKETVNADIELCYGFVRSPTCQLEMLFRDEYSRFQEIRKHNSDILPFPDESEMYLNDGITVEVSLTVSCCRQD